MKTLIISILFFSSIPSIKPFIKSVDFNKSQVSIKFLNNSEVKCQRQFSATHYEYFTYDKKDIFFRPDQPSKVEINIDSLVSSQFKTPSREPATLPIIDWIFFIDSNGEIFASGFKKESTDVYFNSETLRIIQNNTFKAKPAFINNKPVCSYLIKRIKFY
jgi:hypothetical protein